MRNTTRRRYYGRSEITSSLRMASQKLEAALLELKKPVDTPFAQAVNEVVKTLQGCVKSYEVYNMSGKRLKQKILREIKHLQDLTAEMQYTPVFQDEKITARMERSKRKAERGKRK